LKKKTQELEKFKFVLDYKIKELKRDIGPREDDIKNLLETTNTMQQEVHHFNRVNQNLSLIVEDLKMRQSGLITEKGRLERVIDEQDLFQKKFNQDVWAVVKHIDDYKTLKKALVALYKKYVLSNCKVESVNEGQALNKKRDFLEQNVKTMKEKMQKNMTENKGLKQRLLRHNVELLQEINMLENQKHKKTMDTATLQGMNNKENANGSNKIAEYEIQTQQLHKLQQQY
jgi:hypothetical protein